MPQVENHAPNVVRFSIFELDRRTTELRKLGRKVKIEGQPLRLLELLVCKPGEVVTRDEVRKALWPDDTFVDFDHSINAAVKRLRQALDDSAETPRFIETIPKRGYRFICPIQQGQPVAAPVKSIDARSRSWRHTSAFALTLLLAFVSIAMWRGNVLARPGPVSSIRSLAVLPLENLTGDSAKAYQVEGIHDELTTGIAQLNTKGLHVISRTSVLAFRDRKPSLKEIADKLPHVDAIMEGSVREVGDHLRLNLQLISVAEDRQLWANGYDLDLSQAPETATLATRDLAAALDLVRPVETQESLAKRHKVPKDAYEQYLRGRYVANQLSPDSVRRALEHYRAALNLEPAYAQVWQGIAECYLLLGGQMQAMPGKEAFAKAKEATLRALELDDRLWEAHRTLGLIKMNSEDDAVGALRSFERARQLNPAWLGHPGFLVHSGRPEEAIAAARRDVETDPLNPAANLYLGWTYFMTGHYSESIAQLTSALELDSSSPHPHYELAWNYTKLGRHDEAVAECEQALRNPLMVGFGGCGWVYANAGRRKQALKIAKELEVRAASGRADSWVELAKIYDALGQRDLAIANLYRARDHKVIAITRLAVQQQFSDSIRRDSRFLKLLREVPQQSAKVRGI